MGSEFSRIIEAALFVSGRTIPLEELARLCNSGNIGSVRMALEELTEQYKARDAGLEIYFEEGKYGMRVLRELENRVMYLIPEADMPRAVLKTLALIAYEQPVKQSKIIEHRGSAAYKYIRKLREQELIEVKKHGRTKIITTTPKFRDYFQIQDLRELIKDDIKEMGEAAKDAEAAARREEGQQGLLENTGE